MKTIKIFIASSSELKEDRDLFRNFISEENIRLHKKQMFLETVYWENFLDAISDTRLQDEYNQAISECDIVLCLFFTKVGKYTAEEFDTAYQIFKDKGKPKIWTYFKNAPLNTGSITDEINTLLAFKRKIGGLGHFYTEYTNIDNLINKYRSQLDKFLPQFEEEYKPSDPDINKDNDKEEAAPVENNFNKLLTKSLIEAIRPHSRKANDFISTHPDWEKNTDLFQTAKRIIITGFVGVLGIQLRKLMSIGEEEFSDSKMKRYIENCVITAKRALQLVNYALISRLWDHQNNNNITITTPQQQVLARFFKNAVEEDIPGFMELLKTLIEIFTVNSINLPFSQLSGLQIYLEQGSSLILACEKLQEAGDMLKNSDGGIDECYESEKNLTHLLEHLHFLAEYKMISIKDIGYNQQRNDKEGIYLHNYSLLEGDSQFNTNIQGKVKKENAPVISYAVLLFKDDYKQNINLVPFIIDYNALGLNGGSKICFYSFCNTYDDHNLNYSFIEDNSRVVIKKSRNTQPGDEQAFNKWLSDPANRKDMNFDNVFNLFSEAQQKLAGIEEEKSDDYL